MVFDGGLNCSGNNVGVHELLVDRSNDLIGDVINPKEATRIWIC